MSDDLENGTNTEDTENSAGRERQQVQPASSAPQPPPVAENQKIRALKRTAKAEIYLSTLTEGRLLWAMLDMAVVWVLISVFQLGKSKISPFGMVGIFYIASGLTFFIEIFGVLNYMTREFIFKKMVDKAVRQGKDYRIPQKTRTIVRFGTNFFWFFVHFYISFYTLEFTQTLADSMK